jgi:hypothetical protein
MSEKVIRVSINLHRSHRLMDAPSSNGIIYFDNDNIENDVKKIKTMKITGDCENLFNNGLNKKKR